MQKYINLAGQYFEKPKKTFSLINIRIFIARPEIYIATLVPLKLGLFLPKFKPIFSLGVCYYSTWDNGRFLDPIYDRCGAAGRIS